MIEREVDNPLHAIKVYLRYGLMLGVLLVFCLGGWAVATEISGAIIASGHLAVESNVKKVQHPTGGVILEIDVTEGSRVKAGQVMMRLDPTVAGANLAIIENSLDQLAVRQARLEAERDDRPSIAPAARLRDRPSDATLEALVHGEERLFDLRRRAREGLKSQLSERISQLEEEIGGQAAQRVAKEQEIDLINRELEGVRELWRKNLVPTSRLTALERDSARIQGERGLLIATMASAKGKITETKLQILQVDQQFRSDVAKELREIQDKTSELIERQVAANDQLKRSDIRAPQDGVVHDLTVFTVGGVISPSETIMTIVPDQDALVVDARVSPQDISHLHIGQAALLQISAFNQRTTPEIKGEVKRIGADLSTDGRTGVNFYTIRISISRAERERLGDRPLIPGMPVEAFIKTEDRSVMSFLSKPFTDQLMRTFREN
jgi:HlyD family secretion protein